MNKPYKVISLLFLSVILVASILLCLPISLVDGVELSFVDALFTSTSALCVTGLNTIDFANTFSLFGLSIIAILIQLGGLGIICMSVLVFIALGQKIGLQHRILLKNSFNLNSIKGIVKFVLGVFKVTLVIEMIGALLLFIHYVSNYGILQSAGMSLFHSISAFNNAGFDIVSKYGGFDLFTKIITMVLIVLGGLGFLVTLEIVDKRKNLNKLSLQAKIVLFTTIALLLWGTIGYKLTTDLSLFDSLFLSVSTRTAGFSYFNLGNISNAGYLLSILLMFIGASPNSTGGGIKTVTFFVLMLAIYCISRSRNYEVYKRGISKDTVNKSLVILLMGILVIFVGTFLITVFDPMLPIRDVFFETTSAFATVGLSLGITSMFSTASKIVLCFIMFIGRVGILTLLSIWLTEDKRKVKYPEENIIVG